VNWASERLRVVVLGDVVRIPLGGMAWSDMHYLLGLAALGHDVYYLEDSDDHPWSCYDPGRDMSGTDPAYGLAFAERSFREAGLEDRWAYYDAHRGTWLGPCAGRVREICSGADLLFNLGCPVRSWLEEIPVRVLVDKDPVFTQIRNLAEPQRRERAAQHTAHFSFGENIGTSRAAIPADGFPWQATRHPIFLDAWPAMPGRPGGRFTTVMQWESYPARAYAGIAYGTKAASFEPYLDLPRRAGPVLEMTVGSASAPRDELRRHGWVLPDPLDVSRDLASYQHYIQRSKAEFTVAKHGYVVSRSGWFSERSAAYLASGRPAVLEDTNFTDWLPAGAGVLAFRNPDEALAGIEEVNRRYEFHCRAAREIAHEYFDARRVLPGLIEQAMNATAVAPAAGYKGEA
jgi:hypothetical protein